MIKIQLNGKLQDVADDTTLQALLSQYKLERETVIIELNKTLLDKTSPVDKPLQDGDVIEFVRFVGGG